MLDSQTIDYIESPHQGHSKHIYMYYVILSICGDTHQLLQGTHWNSFVADSIYYENIMLYKAIT